MYFLYLPDLLVEALLDGIVISKVPEALCSRYKTDFVDILIFLFLTAHPRDLKGTFTFTIGWNCPGYNCAIIISSSEGNNEGISNVLVSHVRATSNLFRRFTIYPLVSTDPILLDLKMCFKSSNFIMPVLANGLISLMVTTWASMSHSHWGSKKYKSFKVASS